ncbi:alpha/beta hydrolase [Hyphomonas sp. FCG-A18]|uniref:alpha/beta hydrolase n=1 Tax=Hyphomonas sp. FCG-A18 TaxID=3080019 RepID=UPI002B2A6414|nr:alpha/beta hydrolase [Hyphomonas sp. FCG-A18]
MSLQATIAKLMLKLPDSWKVKMAGGEPLVIGGRTLDPHIQLIAHGASKQPPMSSLEPEVAQAAAKEGLAMLAAKPEPGVTWDDIEIPTSDPHHVPVRVYKPADQNPQAPMMAYWHMGGGVILDIEACHAFCSMIAKVAKCPVVSVDYRLAPQHKFPAGLEDCLTAYEWALKNAEKYGAPAGRAAIGGDSMGGNFSAIIAQESTRRGLPKPDLQLLIYPATDLVTEFPSAELYGETYPLSTDTMQWFMKQYLPEEFDRANLLLSPAQEARLEGLPPAIIATAGFDPLVDDGAAYAKKLEAAGVDVVHKCYDSLAHGFTAFTAVVPAAREACLEIAGMVRDTYAKL